MRIGELARLARTSTSALRYYEEVGLLPAPRRTEGGYREYLPEVIGRLRFIQRAKSLGLSLREVRALVARGPSEASAERDRLRHAVAHRLAETRRRVGELQALEAELASLYLRLLRAPGPECGHLGDCACWLPTQEEVSAMTNEVACCGERCCPACSCSKGEPCDCPDCPCCQVSLADAPSTRGVAVAAL